ncbi:MAG: helix-turn-helix transcriptional regulator [Treponema sp.]|uniref:helix-turn-helix domain-containing protein n=1 Tax=Treponema sp. TaxID=166 RepID=UPI0025E4F799|nr:helix-turn-helix transcriptional regulator [Treponema sp.]MBQ8678659.1 helix-turn-helix transcriptional regulator [Treponema sp.]
MNDFDNNLLNSLGSKLRTYRLQKNFSQEKFAELTRLDRTYISGLERGKRNPSYLILKRLCETLEIEPNDLFIGGEK